MDQEGGACGHDRVGPKEDEEDEDEEEEGDGDDEEGLDDPNGEGDDDGGATTTATATTTTTKMAWNIRIQGKTTMATMTTTTTSTTSTTTATTTTTSFSSAASLGASAGWHGCAPRRVLQEAQADPIGDADDDGGVMRVDGAQFSFDVTEGFDFLRLMKGKKGTVANLAEQIGFATRGVKKKKVAMKTTKAATATTPMKAAKATVTMKAAGAADTSWWKEPLTKVRIVNASSPKRTYIVGTTKSSPVKMRLVAEITEKQSNTHSRLMHRILAQIEKRKLSKEGVQKLRAELLR